jgi:hypothetical protein
VPSGPDSPPAVKHVNLKAAPTGWHRVGRVSDRSHIGLAAKVDPGHPELIAIDWTTALGDASK